MSEPRNTDLQRRNGRTLLLSLGLVAGMVGLSFAAVPLYDLFCRVTGFGGTPQTAEALPETALDRTVTIRFNTDTDPRLPWRFAVDTTRMDMQPGKPGFISFTAENTGDKPIVGTAVYNVTPPQAGIYFHKIQCFCFEEQVLMPGQKQNFPVYFYLDPELSENADMDSVRTVTLSYTFFPSKSQELAEAALAYNATVERIDADHSESGAYSRKSVAEGARRSAY